MSRYVDIDTIKIPSEEMIAKWIINSAPSIEIIRCRECKHWCKGDDVYGICNRCLNTRQMRYDDFCSYGERVGE